MGGAVASIVAGLIFLLVGGIFAVRNRESLQEGEKARLAEAQRRRINSMRRLRGTALRAKAEGLNPKGYANILEWLSEFTDEEELNR